VNLREELVASVPIARRATAGAVYRTPLEVSPWLSAVSGAQVSLKLECYQPTGSFKVRGGMTALSQLSAEAKSSGVISATAGNHGLGLAFPAQRLGVHTMLVLPETASPAKITALRPFPVELLVHGATFDDAEKEARRLADERSMTYVSAYNDFWVMAGQATIAPELVEDEPELDVAIVPAGGGSLLGGIAAWLKTIRPSVRVIGVQAEASPALARSLAAGRLVEVAVLPTLADGISGNVEPGSITWPLVQELVDEVVLVSEDEIADAIRQSYDALRLSVEGSAAVGVAALLNGRSDGLSGKRVCVVITGRNIAAETLREILNR
jgi:threonine dehydratase